MGSNIDPTPSALGADVDITSGDFLPSPNGDLKLVGGLDLVEQRIYLRILPESGDLLLHPEVGAGVAALVDEPLTPYTEANISAAVSDQMAQDPAISSVVEVTVSSPQPGVLDIDPVATFIGGLTTALNVPLVSGAGRR